MHEASLVKSLLKQVAQLIREHQAVEAKRIHVRYGPLSGIEPDLFESAFTRMRADYDSVNCLLVLEWCPLIAVCEACLQTFESAELRFDCPRCGSFQIEFTVGEAIILESVELQFNETRTVSA
jgi:hydrogenase nickel incorporation protein HypA/HybF